MDQFAATFSIIALAVLISGAFGACALVKWRIRTLIENKIALKIVIWIPLWFLYVVVYQSGQTARFFFWAALIVGSIIEASSIWLKKKNQNGMLIVPIIFALTIFLLAMSAEKAGDPSVFFLSIMATCALSDVCAFFLAKTIGKHSLPRWINENKYWEGVAGQIIGGVLGIAIARGIGAHELALSLGFVVGIGSALGDMANSVVKRSMGIAQWSQIIPGHGGVIDRFASAAGTGILLFLISIF